MTAGGGRRPPGGPPRVPRSPESPPDGEWPGQVVSLDEIWQTEALFNALATSGTVPRQTAADPAASLLAALIQDLDPASHTAGPSAPDALGRPRRQRGSRRWPVRTLVTGLVAAAAVVLVAVVQPPWPTSGSKTTTGPLAAQLPPTLQVRLPGQHHPSPGNPPLTGPAALMPPPVTGHRQAAGPGSGSPSIPADARSGPASAARTGRAGNPAPAGAIHGFAPGSGQPAGTVPAGSLSVPAAGSPARRAPAWPSNPAARHHGAPRRPPRPGGQHLRPGVPAPAGHSDAGTPHRVNGPSPSVGDAKPWQFWLRAMWVHPART